ncbi:MAG: flavin reductase family protein [Rhodospirillales bacterium]|jgi:flavin reductase
MIAQDLFKRGMRSLAGGVCLITTLDDQKRHGLVATAVASVSADPPSLLVGVNRTASAHDPIVRSEIFCVNVLGRAHEGTARLFGSPEHRDVRFAPGAWTRLKTGAPVFVEALAAFDCEVARIVPYGTHTLWIGRVVAARVAEGTPDPLVYVDGRYCGIDSDSFGLGTGGGHSDDRPSQPVATSAAMA